MTRYSFPRVPKPSDAIPDAEIRLIDSGLFALEDHAEEIGQDINTFLAGKLR